jgi:hypothetical protein
MRSETFSKKSGGFQLIRKTNGLVILLSLCLFFFLIFSPNPELVNAQSVPAHIDNLLVVSTPTPTATPDPSLPVTNKTYAAYFAHSWDIPLPASGADFWIEVDLSEQTLHAYQGNSLLKSFRISSGTSKNPNLPG